MKGVYGNVKLKEWSFETEADLMVLGQTQLNYVVLFPFPYLLLLFIFSFLTLFTLSFLKINQISLKFLKLFLNLFILSFLKFSEVDLMALWGWFSFSGDVSFTVTSWIWPEEVSIHGLEIHWYQYKRAPGT